MVLKWATKLFFFLHRRQLDLYVPPKILLQSKRAAAAQVWKNKLHCRSLIFHKYLIPGFHHFVSSYDHKKSLMSKFIKVLYTVHVVQNCRQNKSRMLLSIVWFSVIFLLFLGPLTGTQIQHRECIQVRIQSDPSSQSLRHGTRPE